MTWPMLFPERPCARCGYPVDQFDAIDTVEIEDGTGKEQPRWCHKVEVCKELLG